MTTDVDGNLACPWERSIGLEEVARSPALAPLAALTPAIGARDLEALSDLVVSGLDPEEAGDLLTIIFIVAGC